ncbi:hypothetical protein AB0G02_36725, partial [Actinosynnema sp. NPDC023658]|uniref:hypothetical protein n=1 Tax=Actinosynnema sp. NPDC023658 TaxID=3155465 RepID=UPI0033DD20A9
MDQLVHRHRLVLALDLLAVGRLDPRAGPHGVQVLRQHPQRAAGHPRLAVLVRRGHQGRAPLDVGGDQADPGQQPVVGAADQDARHQVGRHAVLVALDRLQRLLGVAAPQAGVVLAELRPAQVGGG